MKILITNEHLEKRAGTQMAVRDLALELRRQGHVPQVYSPRLGEVAEEIAKGGIEVTSRLDTLSQSPDVIHGHHHSQVVQALLQFPGIPAVLVCHAAKPWVEEPFYHPRILRYVAVDEACRQRIESTPKIPRERIEVIWNAVDLPRFRRREALPEGPRRALVFSNYATSATQLPPLRKACRRAGVKLDVVGLMAGTAVAAPEHVLPSYDLVFAKGRCALEALAVGNAVVLCDYGGAGELVTTANLDRVRSMTFGGDALAGPLDASYITAQIEHYNARDAAAVCDRIRAEAGLDQMIHRWLGLYENVIQEFQKAPRDYDQEFLALGAYLEKWSYAGRVEWERAQFKTLSGTPLIGGAMVALARRLLRKLTGNYGLS